MHGIIADRLTVELATDANGNVRYADVIGTFVTDSPEGCFTERLQRFHFDPSGGPNRKNLAVIKALSRFIARACVQLNCICYELQPDGTQEQVFPTG